MSAHAEATSASRPKARKAVHPADVQHATDAGLDLLRVIGRLVLHNVTLPTHPATVFDHVVAGPSGVYVINTVLRKGSVSVAGGVLVCAGTAMTEDVEEVAGAAGLVRELLGGAPVAPILCFQRNAEVAGVVGDVAVCSTENILDLLSGQPNVLESAAQREVMRVLSETLVQADPRNEPVESEPAAKPRHRQKVWSLRRSAEVESSSSGRSGAGVAPAESAPAVPKLASASPNPAPDPIAEPDPGSNADSNPGPAPEAELTPDVFARVAALVGGEVEPVAVQPEPAPARPVGRAPARPPIRAVEAVLAATPVEPEPEPELAAPEPEPEPELVAPEPEPELVLPEPEPEPPAEQTVTIAAPRRGLRLARIGGLLARLAPAEPVESVSARKALDPVPERRSVEAAVPPIPAHLPTPTLYAAPPQPPAPAAPTRRSFGVVPAIIAALVVSAVLTFGPQVPDAIAWGKGFFTAAPAPAAGTLIAVPGSEVNPGYDVTASAPVPVAPAPGRSIRAGNRLMAVTFRVHNNGATKLSLPVASRLDLVDELGISYPVATSVTRTALGPTLPKTLVVGPDATLVGTVVFSMPKERTADQIQLELPGSTDGLIAWQVTAD